LYNQFKDEFEITLAHSDKDMYQVPCNHWHLKREVDKALSVVTSKEAIINWATQMLVGDWSTDKILGCAVLEDKVWKTGLKKGEEYVARKGIGPKEAEKLLAEVADYKQVELVLHKAYKEQFGLDWYKEYYKTYQLVTLLRDIPSSFVFDADRDIKFNLMSNTVITAATLFD